MSTSAERPKPKRRWRLPIYLIGAAVGGQAALWAAVHFDAPPKAIMPLSRLSMLLWAIAFLGTLLWLLFLGGFSWRTRLAVVSLLAAGVGAFFFTYEVEWDSMMRPFARARWQPTPEQALEKHRARQQKASSALTSGDWEPSAYDFPRYRGPSGDGVAPYALTAPERFAKAAPPKLWEQPVGGGYAGFAVVGNVLATLEQRGKDEVIVCYRREDGKEAWVHRYPALFTQSGPMGGNGPRSTPTLHDAKVYALGALGDLHCLEGESGNVLWKRNIVKDNGAAVPKWGIAGSPLLVPTKKGDLVVVVAGVNPSDNQKKSIAAYASETGEPVWASGEHPAGYSSPMLAELDGKRQILAFAGGGLEGRDPETGAELWRFDWTTMNDMNIAQPLVLPGNRVFVSSYNEGALMLQLARDGDTWKAKELWRHDRLGVHYASPVYHAGYIYGIVPTGKRFFLTCIDPSDGNRLWRHEDEYGGAQLLMSGGTLLVQTERPCQMLLIKPTPTGYEEIARFPALDGDKTWNTPALAGGFLYLRNNQNMACYDVRPASEK